MLGPGMFPSRKEGRILHPPPKVIDLLTIEQPELVDVDKALTRSSGERCQQVFCHCVACFVLWRLHLLRSIFFLHELRGTNQRETV